MDKRINWAAVAALPVIWFVFAVWWVVFAFVGVFITFAAARGGAYHWVPGAGDRNEGAWAWSWPGMHLWQTYDNLACPRWFHVSERYGKGRAEWLNVWIFSGLRNAYGGNPFNAFNVPNHAVAVRGSPRRLTVRLADEERKALYWQLTQYKWRTGFWVLVPLTERGRKLVHWVKRLFKKDAAAPESWAHVEFRIGWKLYPDAHLYGRRQDEHTAVFSVADIGPRGF